MLKARTLDKMPVEIKNALYNKQYLRRKKKPLEIKDDLGRLRVHLFQPLCNINVIKASFSGELQ